MFATAGPERFQVVALAAGRDAATFQEQLNAVRPRVAALADAAAAAALQLPAGWRSIGGPGCSPEIATREDVDLLVVATGGVVSLRPILAALRRGTPVATANKETLVAGGHLVMPLARELARATRRRCRRRRPPTAPARCSGCGPSIPSTRPSGSAWPANHSRRFSG